MKNSRIFTLAQAAIVLILNLETFALAQTNPVNVATVNPSEQARGVAISGEYAYVAFGSGLRILDISNPANPIDTGYRDQAGPSGAVSVSGRYAYVAYAPCTSLRILDLANPTNPVTVSQIPGSWNCVTVSGRYLFLSPYSTPNSGVSIYNIFDPANPVVLGQIASDCFYGVAVSGSYAYLASCYGRLAVYDVSDPAHPWNVGNSSGGFGFAVDVAVLGNYVYLASWTNRLVAYDVSNPANPAFLSDPYAYGSSVALSGNYAYVAGTGGGPFYPATLSVVDASNPSNATAVAYAPVPGLSDSYGYTHRLAVARGSAYIATDQGLSIFSLGTPIPPSLSITPIQTNALVFSWPAPSLAFAVQQNSDLSTSNWVTLTGAPAPVVIASKNQVIITKPQATLFYRLVLQ